MLKLEGKRFGRLLVINRGELAKRGGWKWKCLCECGKIAYVLGTRLKSGNTTSCGCRKLECSKETGLANKIHGLTRTKVGASWSAMIHRCYNKKLPQFNNYGGRGLIVCEFLRASPINLKMILGDRPEGKSLDRINNDGGYTCGMCRECLKIGFPLNIKWSTRTEQNRNRRDSVFLTIKGQKRHIAEWAAMCGMSVHGIRHRIKRGLQGEDLIRPK